MRFVVDEASLDCDDLEADFARDSLQRLRALLVDLREIETELVGIVSGWGGLMCWRGADVATILNSQELLERDDRLLLLGLLNKCGHIDDDAEDLDPDVSVDGSPRFESYGIAFAHSGVSAAAAQGRAVISLAHLGRTGAHEVECRGVTAETFFVVDFLDEQLFWRGIYALENVAEGRFFDFVARSFPGLWFAPALSFGRFEGSYATIREEVVRHLGALNDDWTIAYVEEAGNSSNISTRIGIDVSRESGNTRGSDELMRERDVEFDGTVYRCEWHSKLEPNRNRIHFHPANDVLGRPLVGIFCDHLST